MTPHPLSVPDAAFALGREGDKITAMLTQPDPIADAWFARIEARRVENLEKKRG